MTMDCEDEVVCVKGCFTRDHITLDRIRREKAPKESVRRLIERAEQGLDLWTGEPLDGQDADNWVRVQDEENEYDPRLSCEELAEIHAVYEGWRWSLSSLHLIP